jgi:hypothetical protein
MATKHDQILITGSGALKKLGLLMHPTVLNALDHKIEFALSEKPGEGVQVLSWFSSITQEDICELTIEARTFLGASGDHEMGFLKEAVLYAAKQAIACLKGKPDFGQSPGKAFSQSLQNANDHLDAVKKEEHQANLGEQMATGKTGKEYVMPQVFPKNKMATDEPIKLIDATALYQPVRGTGGTSRYFVMGVGDSLNLCCRIKGSTLSARVEGHLLANKSMGNCLAELGLTYGKGGHYASMHVECCDDIVAQKTVGSILAALGPHAKWETPMPNVSLIKGIGE